jgi:1-deoxy-D-xylulose-5-phosphate reductoisomerase
MGRKISVDSATMMNKGLELIEACWLFDVPPEKIEFVIHPQSIVHSMVEFVDGSVVAQLGQPDMRTPIAHVLAFPERVGAGVAGLDFSKLTALEFRSPELSRFPVLSMARSVASGPKSLAITFNAANEVAVEAFLAERLSFLNISIVIKAALDAAETPELHSLDDVLACDTAARALTRRILTSL